MRKIASARTRPTIMGPIRLALWGMRSQGEAEDLLLYLTRSTVTRHPGMAWFFRAIEVAAGHWACRHGREEYDTHAELRSYIGSIAAWNHRNRLASSQGTVLGRSDALSLSSGVPDPPRSVDQNVLSLGTLRASSGQATG